MRVFRGNVGQAVLFEAMLRATGRVMKVAGGDEEPLFAIQKNIPQTVFFRKLLVKVNVDGKKIPSLIKPLTGNLYEVTIRYDLTNNKGHIYITREIIEFLYSLVPNAKEIIASMETAEEKIANKN